MYKICTIGGRFFAVKNPREYYSAVMIYYTEDDFDKLPTLNEVYLIKTSDVFIRDLEYNIKDILSRHMYTISHPHNMKNLGFEMGVLLDNMKSSGKIYEYAIRLDTETIYPGVIDIRILPTKTSKQVRFSFTIKD